MGARKMFATLAVLAVAASAAQAQSRAIPKTTPAAGSKFLLEIVGGIGTTVVDVDQWAGSTALDWGTTNYSVTGRLFFLTLGPSARLGVEGGYQYLVWYSVPGLGSTPYEYASSPTHFAGVIRLLLGRSLTFDAGAGAHLFGSSGTKVGILAALGYQVRLSPTLSLPIQLRSDVILTDPSAIPVALNAGLGFRF
jgi:opacity protein-like surface antigen